MNQHTRVGAGPIPFIDLAAQRQRLGRGIDEAIARVLAHGQFIHGPEVAALERELAAFCGARFAVACSSGTDALLMVLMAQGVGPGDAVVCPAFTFSATAEVVVRVGATPVFADVDERTFNLDAASLRQAVAAAAREGLRPRAVIPVDLFGLPADHDAIAEAASELGLFVLDDAAQAFGASIGEKRLGTFGLATATSFFPAKPLGCYGDGGAVFTDDAALADDLRSLRVHGEGAEPYDAARVGLTGRLDTIQAAILLEKLKLFPEEIEARERIARRYHTALAPVAIVPRAPEGVRSVWAQYTIRVQTAQRDALAAALKAEGIPSRVYYPKPLHMQEAYRAYPVAAGGVPVSERLSTEVLSLPMHAYLGEATQDRIVRAVGGALQA